MKYVTALTVTPITSGSTINFQYRAASIFDPDAQVGGHQPFGHDQMDLFYKTYRVNKSMIKIVAVDGAASVNTLHFNLAMIGDTNNAQDQSTMGIDTGTTLYDNLERGLIHMPRQVINMANGFKKPQSWTARYNLRSKNIQAALKNVTDINGVTNTAEWTPMGENPIDNGQGTWFFNLYGANISGATSISQRFIVTIMYDVSFSGPVELFQS